MDYIKEMIGKEIGAFYVSNGNITLFFTDGSDMRIRSGNYSWRICKGEDLILSSADCFAQWNDKEAALFWPMKEVEEPEIIDLDFDEYMEAKFEQLEIHTDRKEEECKELLEGVSIASIEVGKAHDILVSFSNGATLDVFQMIVHDTNDPNECNVINLASDKREKDTVIVL